MKKVCLVLVFFVQGVCSFGQSVAVKLATATQQLEKDKQFETAIVGIYVVDQASGQVVFQNNGSTGLAPASTQKIFTAAAAFELLGQDYRYKTTINLFRTIAGSGIIELSGSGDPSLGSPRFAATRRESLLKNWAKTIIAAGPEVRWNNLFIHDMPIGNQLSIPEGYIWQDIGNYYGAGSSLFNWNENQYDLVLATGAVGTASSIKSVSPAQHQLLLWNSVKAGERGSGDNAYIFAAPFSREGYVKGTIPPDQRAFSISGSMPDPALTAGFELADALRKSGATVDSSIKTSRMVAASAIIGRDAQLSGSFQHLSPSLDSLIYWFLRKSINLYGEALVKTFALEQKKGYNTEAGLEILKLFWQQKNIAGSHLALKDGSGLSPLNRVTARSLVQVLQYCSGKTWYPAFFQALPEYNGMKMKSGSIEGARAFTGYHTSKAGKKYAFAIIVNNYSGSAAAAVQKMYKVLDCLK